MESATNRKGDTWNISVPRGSCCGEPVDPATINDPLKFPCLNCIDSRLAQVYADHDSLKILDASYTELFKFAVQQCVGAAVFEEPGKCKMQSSKPALDSAAALPAPDRTSK